jgi:uncharacterized protein YhdP
MVIKKSARALHRLFWSVAVLVLFLVAAYVSVGRYYIDYVEQYQDDLVAQFVEFTGLKVKVGRLYGTWSNLYPSLTLEDVTLFHPENTSQEVLSMGSITFTIDVATTLTTGSFRPMACTFQRSTVSLKNLSPVAGVCAVILIKRATVIWTR